MQIYGTIMSPSELTYANANKVGGFSSAGDNYLGLLQIQLRGLRPIGVYSKIIILGERYIRHILFILDIVFSC